MKLNLLFVIMYALTILAYPIVFIYSKLYQFSIPEEGIDLTNLLVAVPVTPGE